MIVGKISDFSKNSKKRPGQRGGKMSCRWYGTTPFRQKGLTRGYRSIIFLSGSDSGKEFLLEGGVPLVRSEDVLTLADLKILTGLNLTYLLLHPVVSHFFITGIIDPHPPHHHLIQNHQDMSLDELIEKDYLPPKVPRVLFPANIAPA